MYWKSQEHGREWKFTVHCCSSETWVDREKRHEGHLRQPLHQTATLPLECHRLCLPHAVLPRSLSEYDKLKLFMFHFAIKMSALSIEDDCTEHARSEYNERVGSAFIHLAAPSIEDDCTEQERARSEYNERTGGAFIFLCSDLVSLLALSSPEWWG